MLKVKAVKWIDAKNLLGKAIHIYLKAGGEFYFKVTACDYGNIGGHNDEGQNLWIAIDDIDFIIGG